MKGKPFTVLGFPSNDFGQAGAGYGEEIAQFCRLTYDVTFPMFEKAVTMPGRSSRLFTPSSGSLATCPRGISRSTSSTSRARWWRSSPAK